MKKTTVLEKLLHEGHFADEAEARTWVLLGRVLADEQKVLSVHEKISPNAKIRIRESYKRAYAGKGALKLAAALDFFELSPKGKVCLDCGASTGGFCDVLLARGADKVYAVDAGFGMLAAKLRQDARVCNLERTNLADASLQALSPPPTFITLDLSYLSLKKALPLAQKICGGKGCVIALIKPIFETEDRLARRTGKIDKAELLQSVLLDLSAFFSEYGTLCGLMPSPVRGNGGAVEFFAALSWQPCAAPDPETIRAQALSAVETALKLPHFSKENA